MRRVIGERKEKGCSFVGFIPCYTSKKGAKKAEDRVFFVESSRKKLIARKFFSPDKLGGFLWVELKSLSNFNSSKRTGRNEVSTRHR